MIPHLIASVAADGEDAAAEPPMRFDPFFAPVGYKVRSRRVWNDTYSLSLRYFVPGDRPLAGKSCWEVSLSGNAGSTLVCGVIEASDRILANTEAEGTGIHELGLAVQQYNSTFTRVYGPGSPGGLDTPGGGAGDVWQFAFDAATGELWYGVNGTWADTPGVDPGTEQKAFDTPHLAVNCHQLGCAVEVHASASSMAYPAPAGFTPIND